MIRKELLLPRDHRTSFDLETSVNEAAKLNRRPLETYTQAFPKTPHRWQSSSQFGPLATARSQTISILVDAHLLRGLKKRSQILAVPISVCRIGRALLKPRVAR
jgi:hypothetical protein